MKHLGLLLSTLCLLFLTSSFSTSASGYQIGDTAADFKLKNIDGKYVSLADFKKAKGYIVIFTCNHCPYAKAYEDRIIDLAKRYNKTYPVIAINPNDPSLEPEDSFDNMKIRAKEKKFNFPYLMDEGQKVYPLYGATRTPYVFLLDANREVKYIGAIDDSAQDAAGVKVKYLENAIADVEAGREVKFAQTKAVGCGIKSNKKRAK